MKSFLAIPALFALGAVADSWGFTWTFSNEHSTWTSCTYATENATATPVEVSTSTASWSEWTSTTSYTATYSSGASTWGIPTAVSYSVASNWTSMIPAPTSATSTVPLSTTAAPVTSSVEATKTTAVPSAFTGAAAPNVNGKIAGMGAVALAGLALVL
ncbi:hypothetical protein AYL99_00365 [Fonsecaea erecta]|uniref:Uncharacterized protein n=1 Tax=Fonsecaea erecta TaxID=1367422 RepID=A0A178ZYU4_9EURO|nr:hypothetical protein AYL99_00365 [Fonsecaea erecta]OAP64393.1 hypothetical protein AYL99_00365 [Fonsecaea erecta]